MVDGGHVSRVRVGFVKDKSGLLLFYEDDGVGIPRVEKEKVFLKGSGKGSGLGLFLIRKMCDVYGWTIKETGIPDEEARFEIVVPIK